MKGLYHSCLKPSGSLIGGVQEDLPGPVRIPRGWSEGSEGQVCLAKFLKWFIEYVLGGQALAFIRCKFHALMVEIFS